MLTLCKMKRLLFALLDNLKMFTFYSPDFAHTNLVVKTKLSLSSLERTLSINQTFV